MLSRLFTSSRVASIVTRQSTQLFSRQFASSAHKFVNPYANAKALTKDELAVIRSTVPVLAEHGLTLTTMFYKRMLSKHPELKNVFNDAHQQTGMQPKALADAVHAYAANIDNLTPLLPAVSLITQKHASLSILPEQYPIVGSNLLATLDELLTSAKFPKETIDKVIAAWAVAYGQLSNLLIVEEEKLFAAAEKAPGGWRGWREFVVAKRTEETAAGTIVSFHLKPKDGGAIPAYKAGQFTTIRMKVPGQNGESYYQPRQYTLSAPSDGKTFRISIKREDVCPTTPGAASASASKCPYKPAGVVSNICHSTLKEGSTVELAPPFGDFVLDETKESSKTAPLVLIAAGVGLTPCVSMTEAAIKAGRQVSLIYGCKDSSVHPMRNWFKSLSSDALRTQVCYSSPKAQDQKGSDFHSQGRMDIAKMDSSLLQLASPDSQYFVCGPVQFMIDVQNALKARNVKPEQIRTEAFGSGTV